MFRNIKILQHGAFKSAIPQINLKSEFSQLKEMSSVATNLSTFRTIEANTNNHNVSHLGRLYTVPPKDCEVLFESQTSALPGSFRELSKTLREVCFMVRQPFIDIKNCIDNYSLKLPTLRYLIYGQDGVGKTITLLHMLHFAHQNDFVVVNATWVPLWARFVKEYQASTKREGYFDHTTNAVLWLSHFRTQNSDHLAKLDLKTTKDYKWSNREETLAGSNLTDLLEHGIARPVHASECIFAIVEELKYHSTQGNCKTMVIIDGINAFYHESVRMKDDNRKVIDPTKCTLFEAFRQFFKSDWTGGIVVGSVDGLAVSSSLRASIFPRHLLGELGWEELDPFIPIEVKAYTKNEIQTTIDYYLNCKWLAHPNASTPQAREELEVLSCYNPYTLMKLCASR